MKRSYTHRRFTVERVLPGEFPVRIFWAVVLTCCLSVRPCLAWSEGGHHLIAVLAYDLLTEDEKFQLLEILKAHPRFAEDFALPMRIKEIEETNHWLIGTAAYWPDIVRRQPVYHRSTWHYQLGSTMTIGTDVQVPDTPGPLPEDATLETQELYIAQAVELCRRVLNDKSKPNDERALAICWLGHLVGDAHQPCHAGSLYVAGLIPEGDRGANSIPTKQSKNMHALLDGLLGPQFDAGDIRKRAISIRGDEAAWNAAIKAAEASDGLNPLTWLAESRELGRSHVYAPEVLSAVELAATGAQPLEPVALSDDYLKSAGKLARLRAGLAATRLATIWREGLK